MPIYLYQCPKCGYQSEELVLSKEDKTRDCPKCQVEMGRKPTTTSFKNNSVCPTCDTQSCPSCYRK